MNNVLKVRYPVLLCTIILIFSCGCLSDSKQNEVLTYSTDKDAFLFNGYMGLDHFFLSIGDTRQLQDITVYCKDISVHGDSSLLLVNGHDILLKELGITSCSVGSHSVFIGLADIVQPEEKGYEIELFIFIKR
ncbi:MAG: hypothetical protein ACXQS3_01880 [Candidatus Methanofastidiosia archaeon]